MELFKQFVMGALFMVSSAGAAHGFQTEAETKSRSLRAQQPERQSVLDRQRAENHAKAPFITYFHFSPPPDWLGWFKDTEDLDTGDVRKPNDGSGVHNLSRNYLQFSVFNPKRGRAKVRLIVLDSDGQAVEYHDRTLAAGQTLSRFARIELDTDLRAHNFVFAGSADLKIVATVSRERLVGDRRNSSVGGERIVAVSHGLRHASALAQLEPSRVNCLEDEKENGWLCDAPHGKPWERSIAGNRDLLNY